LKEITIYENVYEVDRDAIKGCEALKEMYAVGNNHDENDLNRTLRNCCDHPVSLYIIPSEYMD